MLVKVAVRSEMVRYAVTTIHFEVAIKAALMLIDRI